MNGRVKGDEKGEYTFTGRRGNTIIDYVIGSKAIRERVKRLAVGEKIDSDHHPLEVVLKDEKFRNRYIGGKGRGVWRARGDEESWKIVRREIRLVSLEESGKQEEWEKIEEKVKLAMGKAEKKREESIRREEGWWNERWERKKKLRRRLREWRKGGSGEWEYKESKREYERMCKRKTERMGRGG